VRVRRFVHILLFLVAGLLLWKIVETWRRPLEEERPVTQQNLPEENPLSSFLPPQPQLGKQYAGLIADKDLFVPSRGRAQVETKPVASVPPPSHLKLVGVVLNRGNEEALFADSSQGGKVVRAKKGEVLGSYKLVGIAPLQATLTMGQAGEEVSLPLLVLDSGAAGQAPRLMPQSMKGNQGRQVPAPGQQPPQPPVGRGMPPPPAAPSQQETHAIRQNIQQLQQRLRQIRKQAARDGNADDAGDAGDEEESENE
jgi:hypothetical protein